jgi:L-iditol 2-dehydrogenase
VIVGRLTADGRADVVERPQPVAGGDVVLVRIDVAPMCTEFRSRGDGSEHEVLGHEAAGVVVDAASSARVKVGDRVVVMPQYACGACRLCLAGEHIYCPFPRDVLAETGSTTGAATYARFVLKPDYLLLPIPDDVSMEHAAAACCLLGPGFHATERMGVDRFDTLLVGGCGPVGLGAIINGVVRGARVLALETNPYRRELATSLGATVLDALDPATDDAILAATDGWGVSASVETSGVPTNPARLARLTERRGRLAVVAWGADVALPPLVPLGLSVFGCWHWNHARYGERMWATIRAAAPLLDAAITHRLPLSDLEAAMDVQASGLCGKVLLLPGDEG